LPTLREASYIPSPSPQGEATVYTQVIESSQASGEPPPSPQYWGNQTAQSPPALGA